MSTLAIALAACSPLDLLNALTPSGTYRNIPSASYGPGPRQRMDIYLPHAGTSPAALAPMVVFFYGGSWQHGSRSDYRFVGEALASRGIVVVVPDYRLYPQVRYPDFLADSAAAVAWAYRRAAEFGADPRRVFVMGHSAGAYNAAMLALDPRWLGAAGLSPSCLAGWLGLAGPYDFLPIVDPDVRPVFFHPDYPTGTQPIDHVSAASIPAFIAAAASDTVVDPQRNTRQLAQKLTEAGVAVRLRLYPHLSHATLVGALSRPLRWLAPVLDDVTDFIRGE